MGLEPMYKISELIAMTKDEAGMGGIDRDTIYDAIKRNELVAFRPNGTNSRGCRVRKSEFERWIKSKEEQGRKLGGNDPAQE